ncbi:MAG TPA: hypothetical protein VKW78_21890 [Terriglobales bacterium]|nr:hypothetical protein [Terriglobales bacterium]
MSLLDRILNRTQQLPKFIDPATHASLDYFVTAYFMLVAGALWGKHRRGAISALINGGMVLGMSMLTDYPGGLKKISFRTHGKGDIVQMMTAAGLPILLGFADSSVAIPLFLQAMDEFVVISATDFDARQKRTTRPTRAA